MTFDKQIIYVKRKDVLKGQQNTSWMTTGKGKIGLFLCQYHLTPQGAAYPCGLAIKKIKRNKND